MPMIPQVSPKWKENMPTCSKNTNTAFEICAKQKAALGWEDSFSGKSEENTNFPGKLRTWLRFGSGRCGRTRPTRQGSRRGRRSAPDT